MKTTYPLVGMMLLFLALLTTLSNCGIKIPATTENRIAQRVQQIKNQILFEEPLAWDSLRQEFDISQPQVVQALLDAIIGLDEADAVGAIFKAHGGEGMKVIEQIFPQQSTKGKWKLLHVMKVFDYRQTYALLRRALDDKSEIPSDPPDGRKGNEPLAPGGIPMRMADYAYNQLSFRLGAGDSGLPAFPQSQTTSPYKSLEERDRLINQLINFWDNNQSALIKTSYDDPGNGNQDGGNEDPPDEEEEEEEEDTPDEPIRSEFGPIDIDIVKPNGTEVEEKLDDTKGWATNVNVDDDDGDGGAGGHGQTKIVSDKDDANGIARGDNDLALKLKLHPTVLPAGVNGVYKLKFSDVKFKIWKTNRKVPADRVVSETTTFDPSKTTLLNVEGVSPHGNDVGDFVTLELHIGGGVVATDKVKLHIADMIFGLFGHGGSWNARPLERYANGKKIDSRKDPYLLEGKDEAGKKRYYSIHLHNNEKRAKIAIAAEKGYVVFDGHSNFGIGLSFTTGHRTLKEFMNTADPLYSCAWPYMRQQQDHPRLLFADSEYGDDPTTAAVKFDPFRYGTTVRGANGVYAATAYSDRVIAGGVRQTLTRGNPKWRDFHFAGTGDNFIILKAGKADYPTPRYRKIFLNSCSSGPYYARVYTTGVLFFTKDSCRKSATSREWVKAIVQGKDNKGILRAINAIENVNDYK